MLKAALQLVRGRNPLLLTEPLHPSVTGVIPGPQSLARLRDLEGFSQDYRTVNFFADYEKSSGNYIADADGNYLLDMVSQLGTLPLGYNHHALLKAANTERVRTYVMHRTANGVQPPVDWVALNQMLASIAPNGLTEIIHATGCGSSAIEQAIKVTFLWYGTKGRKTYTSEELETCMKNKHPGSPNLSILSFTPSLHGASLGCLSCSNGCASAGQFPRLSWPTVSFPKADSPESEAQTLEAVKNAFKTAAAPIAGVIISPLQGDYHLQTASAGFYTQLRNICTKFGAALIVDEVQTSCGATGALWGFQHWSGFQPDLLVYGKRLQVSGVFAKPQFRPLFPSQIFHTYMGDPLRLKLAEVILGIVRSENLISQAETVGKYLLKELQSIQSRSNKLQNVRGLGLMLALELPDSATAWKFVQSLLKKGVYTRVSGDRTVTLQPALIFSKHHADIFLSAVSEVVPSL